ncbi:hypothetical protein H9N25_10360 [Pedobacter riviphilus]|uniref:Phage abortive infection protein n=1 Tax=Pedobacter riviphilus TaxID=2766984 RepID=A0ABX6TN81_9SPHI|nr:hypothetical protein [Pedobacter riviphilus]QNR86747.1 hypothetical protein H9N25_10360 [Pedobacter riviphilus]
MDSSTFEIIKGQFVKIDTILTVIITISVFACGFLVNGLIKELTKYSERAFNRRLVKFNITAIISALEEQINGIKLFDNFLNIDSSEPKIVRHKSIPQLNAIVSIKYHELYKAYFVGPENIFFRADPIRIQCFSDFWSTMYHLEETHESFIGEAKEIIDNIQKHNGKRNQAAGKAIDSIEKFRITNHGVDTTADFATFYGLIQTAVIEWQQNENRVHPSVANELFNKVVAAIQQNTAVCLAHSNLIDVVGISSEANEAIYEYINQYNYIDATSASIKNKAKNYEAYVAKLKYFGKHLCKIKY